MTFALRYAVRTDVGLLREGNEDSAYAGPHLLAVADGMGGYEAGEVASASVISSVAPLDHKLMPDSELVGALSAAVDTAKDALRSIVESDPSVGSMGTTLTAMLWSGDTAAICHIGDSRAYLLRDGDFYQVTRDHTFVQALIDQGRISPDEAASHPNRSLLLRALDGRSDADPDIALLTAQAGDRFLLCSDGLPVVVSDEDILQALSEAAEPTDAVLQLIDLAIRGGGPDNITCIVADVIDTATSRAKPTMAPVIVGAAASGASHETRPLGRIDADRDLTRVAAMPPTAVAAMAGAVAGPSTDSHPRVGHAPARPQPPPRSGALGDQGRGRRRWPLMTSILALFVLLIGGGLFFAHAYLQSQYYVGNYEGRVAIYRGVNQKVLGISLYSLYRPTSVPVSGIPTAAAQQIPQSATGSLAQAERFVANVGGEYHRCVAAHAALQRWEAGKPKPIKVHRRVNGKIVTRTVTPPYHKPKPSIPVYCPQQFSALPHT